MTTPRATSSSKQEPESRHISLRADAPPEAVLPQPSAGKGVGGAVVTYAVLVLIYVLAATFAPEPVREAILPERIADIVWLPTPGPGGGGGGGNEQPEPPAPAELPGRDEVSVPAPPPAPPEPEPTPVPRLDDTPELNVPVQTLASSSAIALGSLEPNAPSTSTGSGSGTGAGAGQGSGLGEGSGGGTGGGVFRPGSGIELPRVLREVRPQYTAEAMRAKVQGTVVVECVVLPDGTVGDVEVVRSLDPVFGLDQEAVRAARQWRFAPGTRFGEPVAVLVTIELSFTLR